MGESQREKKVKWEKNNEKTVIITPSPNTPFNPFTLKLDQNLSDTIKISMEQVVFSSGTRLVLPKCILFVDVVVLK